MDSIVNVSLKLEEREQRLVVYTVYIIDCIHSQLMSIPVRGGILKSAVTNVPLLTAAARALKVIPKCNTEFT